MDIEGISLPQAHAIDLAATSLHRSVHPVLCRIEFLGLSMNALTGTGLAAPVLPRSVA